MLGALLLAGLLSCSGEAPAADRSAQARSDLGVLVEALEGYHALHGEWPETLTVLVRPDGEGHHFLPGGTSSTFDPWGRAYVYERLPAAGPDAAGYRLVCLGSDGAPGGSGVAADLSPLAE